MGTLSGQLVKGTLRYNVGLNSSAAFDLPENATLKQLAVFEEKIHSTIITMSEAIESAYGAAFDEPLDLSEELPNVCELAQSAA